jgi:hypothetical protein
MIKKNIFHSVLVFVLLLIVCSMIACGKNEDSSDADLSSIINRCALNTEQGIGQNSKIQKAIFTASELEKKGCLQEAIWINESLGDTSKVKKLSNTLRTLLSHGDYQDTGISIGGTTGSKLFKFSNDIYAIYKTNEELQDGNAWKVNYESEIAAFQLDQLLKLSIVPMTVERQIGSVKGSIQYFMGDVTTGYFEHTKADNFGTMAVFDFLIGNIDRVNGNFLYWKDQMKIVAIDHGAGFQGHNYSNVDQTKEHLKKEPQLLSHLQMITQEDLKKALTPYVEDAIITGIFTKMAAIIQAATQ